MMVAYSFMLQFVPRIRAGLGQDGFRDVLEPKRQTIRAPRKGSSRHARPGDELQHYYHQRLKDGFLIGKARCTGVETIVLKLCHSGISSPLSTEYVDGVGLGLLTNRIDLDAFATRDGFNNWDELRSFWRENHPGIDTFEGVLIRWEPLEGSG